MLQFKVRNEAKSNEESQMEMKMMQMEEASIANRISAYSTGSSNCSDGGKDPPKSRRDFTQSAVSFTPGPASTPRNNRKVAIHVASGMPKNEDISLPIYTPILKNGEADSMSKEMPPTPDSSVFDMNSSIELTEEENKRNFRKNMVVIYSCIYGVLLTVIGGIILVNYQSAETRYISEIFSVCISLVGMTWLVFFHIDLFRYKRKVMRKLMGTNEQIDKISTNTDFNFAITFLGNEIPPYRFLTGRHSGSFYLKVGLAAFCFGHLINEGLLLGQEVMNFTYGHNMECGKVPSLLLHLIKPLYSFYQLFIVFKYSNIVINRHKMLACFGLVHTMGTCLCFWFGTIVEDALEDYHHKLVQKEDLSKNASLASGDGLCSKLTNESYCLCASKSILSVNHIQAIPYLYPFTIEFNLLLAGVWFIVWTNIGKEHHKANPHHFRHKIHNNDGIEEVIYQSNLVISADCHASNKGLFAGILVLLGAILSIIVFFVAMNIKDYHSVAFSIHYFQEGTLNVFALCGVLLAYKQLSNLDYNQHPITFLDDVLLFLPLPFYFLQAVLIIISEHQNEGIMRVIMSFLVPVQVILQTPVIIDGLRRCSNSQVLKYKKPGRELVTFLIVCNLTIWIINTFEAKSVESHYGLNAYFGEFLWMFVSHTTLPLMLFYRFHSSVCLADIWKSAYEKGE